MSRSIRNVVPVVCALALAAGPVLAQVGSETPPPSPPAGSASAAASASVPSNGAASDGTASAAPSGAPSAYAPIVLSPGVGPVAKPVFDKPAPAPAPVEVRGPWFGWQLLAVDVVVVGASVVLLRTQEEDAHLPIFLAGSALYLATGPLLHLANGNGRNALSSLILRGAAIAGGAAFGAIILEGFAGCTARNECKLSTVDYAAIGAGVGVVVGTIVDASVFAWKPGPASATAATPASSLRPDVRLSKSGATFGLAFAF